MYKKMLIAVCLLLFSSYAVAQKTVQKMPKKQALLVGVANYRGIEDDLPAVYNDIKKMKTLFVSWGFEVRILKNKDALKLEQALNYYSHLDKDDMFIFYYSGHGSFIPDKNENEVDHQDETLVLSDGRSNKHIVDDDLDYLFKKINARKLLLFDSCHSGTVNKGSINQKIKVKSISPAKVSTVYRINTAHNKNKRTQRIKVGEGGMISLSASKDKENSLTTPHGSLFTNELYALFSHPDKRKKSLESIRNTLTYNIVTYCKQNKKQIYHPQLSASSVHLKGFSIEEYLKLK